MSDDFGTVSVKRGERSREIEVMREQYRRQRETLESMIADAPTEHLAAEYRRLVRELDVSMGKLDELEEEPSAAAMRPLVTTGDASDLPASEGEPGSRLPLILAVAVIALCVIGWLIWRASSDRKPDGIVPAAAGETTETTSTTVTQAETIAPVAEALTVSPPSHDYGIVRKGTRATRQFEISNTTDQPITIEIARSTCRCFFYEYESLIPPKAKESVTVTIDGARAQVGQLREAIRVTAKGNPTVGTSFDVIATVQ